MSPASPVGRRFVGDVAAFATAVLSTIAALATTLGGCGSWPAPPPDPVAAAPAGAERSSRPPPLELLDRDARAGACPRDTSASKE